ncbi:MAG TPA: carboxylesterase family protein [Bryobacteraceae bacterium]|nr:carboxylesterase family protein [Bryobacteraceae bacterium]
MSKTKGDLSRRSLLTTSVVGGAMAAVPGFAAATLESKSISSVVDTSAGKVRGVLVNGVHVYRGIPYGASTTGSNRFMPPRKPEPWTGVRDAFQNGHSSPQNSPAPGAIGWGLRSNAQQGEDCLVLNVFSNGVNDGRKRPVMVWIHGGGYTYGSGGSLGYDGANLARTGDVTVVCINHRLNIFGHLYLGAAGPEFVDSGNVGLLDIAASLEWVRDNIARFGGDPANVTIFGQSGGGGKVSTLLAMPAAKGLFHKAIVESGSTLKQTPKADAEKSTEMFMSKLGLKPNEVRELQELPLPKLLAAMGNGQGLRLAPVVDGHSLPRDPFDPTAPDISAEVPMIVGTAETEGSYFAPPELLSLEEGAVRARLRERLHNDGDRIYNLFRKNRPHATPSELYFTISAFPTNAHVQAERKAALGRAPAFLYQIRWRTPVEGGRRLAPHCIEIPFAMQNHWQLPEMVGTGPELQPLADKTSGAWVAFARTGNPNHSGIPKWPAYNATDRATMHIDNEWKPVNDPDREERLALADLPRLPMF